MSLSKPNNPPINEKWVKEIPEDVIEGFKGENRPVFFIGSGFGKEAIPPLKTGGELARELRDELGLEKSEESLSELLQYYMNHHAGSKRMVIDWLKKKLNHGVSEPGGSYRLILELPTNLFFTTNYDSLLMKASHQMGYNLKGVDDSSSFDSNYNDVKSTGRGAILGRLHGDFEHQDNIVATTNDYIKRFSNNNNGWQSLLEEIFRTRQVIFIGYSLKDFTTWTSFVSVITKWENAVLPHVMVAPAKSEHISRFWNNYKIKYIPLKASQFLIALHDQLWTVGKSKEIAIAATAAYTQKSYDASITELEKQKKLYGYPSFELTAQRIIMEGNYENQ